MSATFCDQAKSKQQKLKQKVKKANNTDSTKFLSDTIQPKHRTEMTEPTPNEKMFSSTGFTLNTGELKQGLTLDKVLGGGFKRIDIFSNPTNDFNEFEAPELLPQHILDDKINDLSDPEEDARYKSFEIVETENEEEANGDSPQKNQAKTIKGNTKKPKYESEPQDEERDQDIRERINRKYRHKPNRTYYKPTRKSSRSPESFSTNDNPSFKEDEGNENLEERGRANMQPKPSGSQHRKQEIRAFIAKNLREIDANRNCHSTKGTESRSVSPESLGGSRQSRFQNTFFQGSKNKTKDGFNNSTKQYSLTRQTFHKDSKNENTSPFETSFNGFNKGRGREKERLTSLDKKQGFAQSYGLDPDRGQHYKTYSTFNGDDDKQRSSGSKFFGSKSNLRAYELKNPKEHNQIADRIKQHENAMLEKYSNKKLVEQHESNSI